MNSLFNYELDERQIRMTLRDTDLEFSETAWEDFDRNYTIVNSRSSAEWKMPNIQLNINRNVLVPVFFILGLAGISALMFSFIDFKENKEEKVEKVLVPNPDNYKKPVQKIEPALAKNEDKKPVEVQSPVVKIEEPKTAPVNTGNSGNSVARKMSSETVTTPTLNTNPAPVLVQPSMAAKTSENKVEPDTANPPLEKASAPIIVNESSNHTGKKKRRKRVNTEQIETIKAPSLLGEETATQEPELELKLN
jgi:hypothetical protein